MRKLSMLIAVMLLLGSACMADTFSFTPSTPGVKYAINDGVGFYVSNSGITSPNGATVWSMPFFGSFWQMAATPNGAYSDAGIVLFFDNPLSLGSLYSVDVKTAGTMSPLTTMNLNLWLDTGGDGEFFTFSGNQFTNLAGDSYGGAPGFHFGRDSSFYMFGGNGAGQSVTLSQLQNGAISGIDGNTRTALWVGITDYNGGTLSQVDVTTVPEPASLTLLGAGLIGIGTRLRKRFSR